MSDQRQRVRRLFDDKAARWHEKYEGPLKARRTVFRDALVAHARPGGRVLDFGCGSGDILLEAARSGFRACGLDISQAMMDATRAQLDAAGIEAELFHGTLEDVSPELGRFDAIVCSSVLEYVPDAGATLTILGEHLESGGVVIASLPNRESVIRRLESVLRLGSSFWRHIPIETVQRYVDYLELSVNRYAVSELELLGSASGLRLVASGYVGARVPLLERVASPMIVAVMAHRP